MVQSEMVDSFAGESGRESRQARTRLLSQVVAAQAIVQSIVGDQWTSVNSANNSTGVSIMSELNYEQVKQRRCVATSLHRALQSCPGLRSGKRNTHIPRS